MLKGAHKVTWNNVFMLGDENESYFLMEFSNIFSRSKMIRATCMGFWSSGLLALALRNHMSLVATNKRSTSLSSLTPSYSLS